MAPPLFSPRSVLLCVLFLFSTNVLAISAVLGVDLGTEYIKATLVKPGIPLEIVLTKDSRRKETSAVAFKPSQHALQSGSYPERAYGSDAIALAARFPGDVYPNLKTLLGLPIGDSIVQEYAARHPSLQLEAHKSRGTVAFKSKATEKEEAWMVEELLAMELQSIQRNAEALAGSDSTVRSVVITVPPFYTVDERRALELACELVGLKVMSQISDGLAVGLNYATSRTFPNVNEGGKSEYHMVFDMGAGSTKATVMKFQGRTVKDVGKYNKTVQEVQVLGSGWDRTLGGDAFNYLIVDDMISKFIETKAAKKASVTAEDIRGHGRAMAKMLKDAERLRHVLSANVDTAASFEGLYEDIDFRYKVSRADFEKMTESYAERVGVTVQKALDLAELDIMQLDSIILHGGASRTPFVQKQLEKIAGGSDKLRSNVNSDEAAVFGAGFRAAELSPSFRVKEIRVSEAAAYAAGMKWTTPQNKPQQQRLWTERSLLSAAPKEVVFTNREDFSIRFFQQVPSAQGVVEKETKEMTTKNLTATVASLVEKHGCTEADIQFKVQLRLGAENGEVQITKASVECETEAAEKEGIMDGVKNLFGFGKSKDQKPLTDGEESSESETTSADTTATSSTETAATPSSSNESAESNQPPKRRLVVIPVDYSTEQLGIPGLSKTELTKAKDRLKAFEASDKARRLREETLNQLEGFTYKVRDLLDSDAFVAASTSEERTKLESKASDASDWLYGDGVDAPREKLKSRLKELKDLVSPIEKRIEESSKRPELIKSLKDSLNQTSTWINTIKEQIREAEDFASSASASATSSTEAASSVTAAPSQDGGDFDGLEDEQTTTSSTTTAAEDSGPPPPLYTMEDMTELTELYESIMVWLEEKIAEQDKLPETANPALLVKDLTEKAKKLEQAGIDMAMRSVKKFESKFKKNSSSKKSSKSKTKTKSATKTSKGGSEPTIDFKFGENGEMPSAEEIEEMIKKMGQEQKSKDEAKTKHDEL
ncbi:actin-like ATPase domain-containing protein [Xylariaceae sp. AK1471]|nr:actin-like ATPase domain-containing protein [Xylariaceae sp. AK1471]